jgi:hypothetical protein
MSGWVYCMMNPCMHYAGRVLYKIGEVHARGKTPWDRVKELYQGQTGVPIPFTVLFAKEVRNPRSVERRLHQALDHRRINPRREFFDAKVSEIRSLFDRIPGKYCTVPRKQVAVPRRA